MKRILCIIAMVMAVLYLAVGSGILVFQDLLKPLYIDFQTAPIRIYPINAVIQLILVGLPCTVLAAVKLTGSHADSRALSGVTVGFCSAALITHHLIGQILNNINSVVVSRMYGANYLASLSTVNSLFSYTCIFIDAALVLLLISSLMQTRE